MLWNKYFGIKNISSNWLIFGEHQQKTRSHFFMDSSSPEREDCFLSLPYWIVLCQIFDFLIHKVDACWHVLYQLYKKIRYIKSSFFSLFLKRITWSKRDKKYCPSCKETICSWTYTSVSYRFSRSDQNSRNPKTSTWKWCSPTIRDEITKSLWIDLDSFTNWIDWENKVLNV